MKFTRDKTATLFALFLMLSMLATSCSLPPAVEAQNYVTETVQTFAYLACRPNPVGVNQPVLVNIWCTPPTDYPGIVRTGYVVKITPPNGTVITNGPMNSIQADGSAWFNFVPDAVGNWTLQFIYPGDYIPVGTPYQSYNPPFPIVGKTTYAVNYTGSESPVTKLTVQEEQIPGYQPTPLPTEYWTRPVSIENREWNTLLGDWYQTGYDSARDWFQPYGPAPNTAHILWVRETGFGGMVGGQYNYSVYSSPQYTAAYVDSQGVVHPRQQYWNTVYDITFAIGGYGYYNENGRIHCIDLRNGNELWAKPDITITAVKNEEYTTRAQGVPIVGYTPYLMQIGSTFKKWSASTGDLICSVPGMSGVYDNNRYVYSVQNLAGQRYLIKWDTDDIMANFTRRIVYNVTYPLNGITGIYDDVGFYFGTGTAGTEEYNPVVNPCGAFDCATGQTLWVKNYTIDMRSFSGSAAVLAAPGVYVYPLYNGDPNQSGLRPLAGIDIHNGNFLFDSTVTSYPWGSFWTYSASAAYGLAYYGTYDGYVYAFNTTTGKIAWKGGHNNVGYETPYGWQPFFSAILTGDGKVYAGNDEHSEGPPYYQGKQLWCLNATTGKTIWSIAFWLPGFGAQAIIADGKLIGTNYYDGRQYCFGMGPSKTTVTAPDVGVTTTTPVTIRGTVTDISGGSQQQVVAANFPNGLPCVSDASMSQWMEYVYMQKLKPTNVTGVPVTISVLDSNGNQYDIGTTTTDASGTYALTWTPQIPGDFTVYASFAGTQSYYGSSAETHFYASEAPAATPAPTQPPASIADLYLIPGIVGIIIAIAVVGAVLALMLRKR